MIINKSLATEHEMTLINKSQSCLVDEHIDFTDLIVKKPWGYEYLLFENDDVAIWILHINAFSKTSMHAHPNKNTSLICLSGEVFCKTLDDKNSFGVLDGIYLGKKVFHQTLNETSKEAIIMEIETPVNKFDLVRFKDEYGRADKSYESSENYVKKDSLSIRNLTKESVQRVFDTTLVEIGFANDKSEFLEMCKNKDDKMIITLLNRNIWSKLGEKVFNVGQVMVYSNELIENSAINDKFVYLILKRN